MSEREQREARLYEETMGKPPPEPIADWQLSYRGTREERERLAVWLDTEWIGERGEQPEQEEALF